MKQNGNGIIRTVSDNQSEILESIVRLYCPNGFGLDPTYSKGVFYKNGVPEPKYKSDLAPQQDDVMPCDCRELPFPDGFVENIVFDPPFIGASQKDGKPGIIKTRFSYFPTIPKLWAFYSESLTEFHRVLQPDGILVFKCQDSVESAKQYITHVEVMNTAYQLGFYTEDLFVLTANNRLISPNQWKQQHARKYHSYFWVFRKTNKRSVLYPSIAVGDRDD
jgi:hypothetical protein